MRFNAPLALAVTVAALLGAASAQASTAHLDRRFGSSGIRPLTGPLAGSEGAALLGDGRVLVGTEKAVAALLPSGRIDPGFGDAGFAPFVGPAGGTATIAGLAVDPAGRPVAYGGWTEPAPLAGEVAEEPVVDRYSTQGRLDTGFGEGSGFSGGGLALPPAGPGEPASAAFDGASFDPAGHLYLEGKTLIGTAPGPRDEPIGLYEVFLARLEESGADDTTFAGTGVILFPKTAAVAVAVDPQNRIVVPIGEQPVLTRLLGDGEPDPSFGVAGSGPPALDFESPVIDGAGRLSGLTDRSGSGPASHGEVKVRRLEPDGSLDRSFGSDGVATLRLPSFATTKLALDESGRLLVAEAWDVFHPAGETGRLRVVRLRPDGRPDRSFGDHGAVAVPLDHRSSFLLEDFEVRGDKALLSGKSCGRRSNCGPALAVVDLGGDR